MNPKDYKTISVTRRGRVLILSLNRPEALNAVNGEMHEELSRVFIDAQDDKESDIVMITGSGKAFSAGGDIGWLKSMTANTAEFDIVRAHGKRIIFSMLDCEKPIVAKINGPAVGLGCTIALFSDIIFAAEDAVISDPHVSVGLVAGDGGAVIWPQLIGYARAKEYLMTGKRLSGSKAAEIGLVNHAVPTGELDAAVDAFCDDLLAGALLAIKYTKVSINISLKQLAHSILDTSLAYETITNRSKDHLTAVTAFVNREKPTFTGE
ncbi:MAG: enoyl-CoA hydratase/isomerase family protein [Rhodospirillaceae bacterium]